MTKLTNQSNEKKQPLKFSDPSDRVAKKKRKKAGIISFALSGAMVVGLLSATFLPKPETARAFESLPEIETIKSTLNGSGKALKILEVVGDTDDAVFGYYVEGQEPKDFDTDVLSGSHSNAERTQAASDYFVGLANNGILGVNWIHGAAAFDMPLSATVGYTEYYPWEEPDDDYVTNGYVHEIDTKGETVTVSGSYRNEGAGNGAFALTGSSFEAVDTNGKYVQDIETGETGRGAVFVPASDINDSDVKDYMFYKVRLVPFYVGTDDNNEAVFYKEADKESDERFVFTGYDGKYVLRGSYDSDSASYYGTIVDTSEKNPLDREWIVSGDDREPYFILDTMNLDNEKPVSGDDLLLDATKRAAVLGEDSGWYGISMNVPFITVPDSGYAYKANFNIVPKGFIYKGKGKGQFNIGNVTSVAGTDYKAKGESETLTKPEPFSDAVISYDKVSYAIEVTNNNLFLKYVLDCVDEDAALISSRAKSIQVDAVEASALSVNSSEQEFSKRGQHYSIADYDLIVFEKGNYSIPDDVRNEVLRVALDNEDDSSDEKAMIIDADSSLARNYLMMRAYSKEEDKAPADQLTGRVNSFISGASGFAYGYTDGNLFFFRPGSTDRTSIVTKDIKEKFDSVCYTAENSAFYGVISGIEYENVLREKAGGAKLDEWVDLGKAIRYILNYKQQRVQTLKTAVKILEIEPTDRSELRRSKVAYPDGTGKNNKDNAYPNPKDDFEPFVYEWFGGRYIDDDITLSTMSTYEFVGKIDDITEDYDLIYIGSDITDFHTLYGGDDEVTYPFDLPWTWHWHKCVRDNRNENNLWTNAQNPGKEFETNVPKENREYRDFIWKEPGVTKAGTRVPVMYETDQRYWWNGTLLYDVKKTTTFFDTGMNGLVYYNIGDYTFSGEGDRAKGLVSDDANNLFLRYSGNDLTEKKLVELKAFADDGYPVVFADNLINITSSGKAVNNERVDVNSRMYSFIDYVKGKANTYTSNLASLSEYSSKLMLQLSLSKPMIYFVSKPKDYTESGDHNAIANRTLSFTFKILNETDPTPLSTTYSLHLYIDRGADGIFSDDDEIEIASSDLKGGDINSLMGCISEEDTSHVYTLNRELPEGIKGMVSWKLLVEKNGGGLHASEKGYAYTPVRMEDENNQLSGPITINILQINTKKDRPISDSIGKMDTYSLQWQDETYEGPFGKLFKQIEDNGNGNYQLNITTVTTDKVNEYYNESHDDAYYANPINQKYNINNEEYNMLIIGFGDAYGELVDKTATAVTEFIESGKAVLFSHDNTAPCNDYNYYLKNPSGGHGYYFNTIVRDSVGLDRYGVTNDDTLFSYTDSSNPYYIHPVNYILGGSKSVDFDGNWVGPGVLYNRSNLLEEQMNSILNAGYDIAYKPSRKITDQGKNDYYVHGFTDLFIEGLKPTGITPWKYKYEGITDDITGSMANYETDTITMENEGQITKYPFNIEKSVIDDSFMNGRDNLKVSTTHLQYYQMNMTADDLIVWYCLGHRSTRTEDDLYSFVPNDVANQYYIFTRGNITYSGCGHGGAPTHWVDPTEDEAKLFVNTMIAAYRAGYSAPEFKFVASAQQTDNMGIQTVVMPYETVGQLYEGAAAASDTQENNIDTLEGKINFRFTDTNLDAGRTMGLAEFEIIFPDPYKTKVYEPADKTYRDVTFTHDDFRLMIDEEGHLKFGYKQNVGDQNFTWVTSTETVKFYDSDGNVVQNGKFQTGKVYSLDIQDLAEIFTKYTSRTTGNISEKERYRAPDTFPLEFSISTKPVTYFANGTKIVAEQPSTLTVSSLKMFDIG